MSHDCATGSARPGLRGASWAIAAAQAAPFARETGVVCRLQRGATGTTMNACPDLDGAIRTAFREGHARWPTISMNADLFSAHVQRMNPDQSTLARNGADLYLA